MEMNFKQKLQRVRTLIFDVDGVLTDGSLLVMPDGEFLRRMNIKDGYAMSQAIKQGYRIAIISGGHSSGVPLRLRRLGVEEVHMGVENKLEVYEKLLRKYNISDEEVLYMGDDVPDLPVLRRCGVPCCPSGSAVEVEQQSIYVSHKASGEGCVRDVIEQVMRLHGKWVVN